SMKMNKKDQGEMPSFPMRINKYLAHKGYASRREADTLIEQKRVYINGKLAELGDKVTATDTVEVKTNKKNSDDKKIYIAFHKPAGIVTNQPQEGQQAISDLFPYKEQG